MRCAFLAIVAGEPAMTCLSGRGLRADPPEGHARNHLGREGISSTWLWYGKRATNRAGAGMQGRASRNARGALTAVKAVAIALWYVPVSTVMSPNIWLCPRGWARPQHEGLPSAHKARGSDCLWRRPLLSTDAGVRFEHVR